MWFKLGLLTFGAISLLAVVNYFTPPADAVGSTINNFDEPHFQRRMIKLEADQRDRLGFPLS